MSTNIYGGIIYPNSSFIFDRIYNNYEEAINSVNNDGVLLGRYVLITYCEEALSQDVRNQLEAQVDGNPENNYTNSYQINYKKDKQSSKVTRKKSYDRIVLRKKYLPGNPGSYIYEEIASLNSSLSDNSILFRAIQNQGADQILSLSDLDNGGILSTTLNIRLANHDGSTWIQLIGVNDGVISEIDADDFIADGMIDSVTYNDQDNTLIIKWNTWNANTDSYTTTTTSINLYDIIEPYSSGNGITVDSIPNENPKIAIKLDPNTETFLTVGENGLKLSGLQSAIDSVKNVVKTATSLANLGNGINTGDIGIVITTIADGKNEYTAYVWNSVTNNWQAMDGNYNADNVILDYDLTITKDIGVQTLGSNSYKILNTTGKSVSQVLNMIVAKEEPPSIVTQPKVTTSIGNGDSSTPSSSTAIAVEGGTTIVPKWSASFNAGAYKYGPPTGITQTAWDIKGYIGSTAVSDHTSTSSFGTFSGVILKAGQSYKVNAKATYIEGPLAYTNLGEEYKAGNALFDETEGATSVRITGGSKSGDSPTITAWQQGYYIGTLENKNTAITSNILRNIGDGAGVLKNRKVKNNNYAAQTDLAFSPSGTMAKFVVAIPATQDGEDKGMTSFFNNSSFEEYINNFTKTTLKVAGADNNINSEHAVDYTVYTWTPAAAFTGTINFIIDFI